MNQEKIGNFIQRKRKEKKLTQQDLAKKLNVTDKAISKWETGRGLPDISLLENLSNILGVSVNELIYGEELSEDKIKIVSDNILINTINCSNEEIKSKNRTTLYILITTIIAFIISNAVFLTQTINFEKNTIHNNNQNINDIITPSLINSYAESLKSKYKDEYNDYESLASLILKEYYDISEYNSLITINNNINYFIISSLIICSLVISIYFIKSTKKDTIKSNLIKYTLSLIGINILFDYFDICAKLKIESINGLYIGHSCFKTLILLSIMFFITALITWLIKTKFNKKFDN